MSSKGKKVRSKHIKSYNDDLEKLKKNKHDFNVVSTSFTKKIITEFDSTIYKDYDEDNDEFSNQSLILISMVRNDAKKYLERHPLSDVDIDCDFFNLLDVIRENEVIVKVDIKSAYWEYAIKSGIISEATNLKLNEFYGNVDIKYAKQARLKALGSLATTKVTKFYEDGKLVNEEPKTEPTKKLYMTICQGVDRLMKQCNLDVPGCKYYYWDCIFVLKEFEQQAIDFLNGHGYNVTTQETKLEHIKIGECSYILSIADNKIYMTREENRELIEFD